MYCAKCGGNEVKERGDNCVDCRWNMSHEWRVVARPAEELLDYLNERAPVIIDRVWKSHSNNWLARYSRMTKR